MIIRPVSAFAGSQDRIGIPGNCGASFLQTAFWGGFKREFGWKDRFFLIEHDGKSFPLLVLERKFAKLFSLAYVPDGPAIELSEPERALFLPELGRALEGHLARNCVLVRFDPPWSVPDSTGPDSSIQSGHGVNAARHAGLLRGGRDLVRAVSDIQPPDTVVLDLGKSEDELLAAMKPKWRYNVRLSEKKGVAIEEIQAGSGMIRDAISRFYKLYRATAARDRIALHPEIYYERLAALAAAPYSRADLRVWIATYGGEDLAAIITLFMDSRAVYLYGASQNSHRNLMPAYALQWSAIRAARASGCAEYDFYGIPPTDDPDHPMAGLYRFKTGFGGRILHKPGSWDYPRMPIAYRIFRSLERIRKFWFKKILKMSRKGPGDSRNAGTGGEGFPDGDSRASVGDKPASVKDLSRKPSGNKIYGD